MGVQPICFWDVMPIPRHALTIAPFTEQPNTGAGPNSHAAPRGKPRTTLHDYHPRHDKVNATINPNKLALALRVAAPNVYDIIHERRGISSEMSLRLARYFRTTPEILD
jgi:hypothetical protein